VRPLDEAVFDNSREQPHRRKNPASRGRTTAHAGEQLGTDAGNSPAGGKVAKLINSKFGHLHETKHLAAKVGHLR
jgi:hypothetical protein